MKRIWVLLTILVLVLSQVAVAGAAPNAGDATPDGIGVGEAYGPAPNSGDGVPDGSGFDGPYKPNG